MWREHQLLLVHLERLTKNEEKTGDYTTAKILLVYLEDSWKP